MNASDRTEKTSHPIVSTAESSRPNVLAGPSHVTGAFLIVMLSLVTGGLFAGTLLHNDLYGPEQVETTSQCLGFGDATPGASACRWMDQRLGLMSLAGGIVAVVVALAVVTTIPYFIRHRRSLYPLRTRLEHAADTADDIARAAGIRTLPTWMTGSTSKVTDAFTYGAFGRYCVVLPLALSVKPEADGIFGAVVRHELAHLKNRDVLGAWMSRSLVAIVGILLSVPLFATIPSSDWMFAGDVVVRGAIVLLGAYLAGQSLLRIREHTADLAATQPPLAERSTVNQMDSTLALLRGPRRSTTLRRLRANHPGSLERRQVLRDPGRYAILRWQDCAAAGLFAGTSTPLLWRAANLLVGSGSAVTNGTALLLAALLSVSLGAGIWRAVLVGRITASRSSFLRCACVFGLCLAAGKGVTLATAGILLSGFTWGGLLAVALAGVVGFMVAVGIVQVWADSAPYFSRAMVHWALAWLPTCAVFTLMMLAVVGSDMWLYEDLGRRLLIWVGGVLPEMGLARVAALIVLTSCMAAALFSLLTRNRAAPKWLMLRGDPGWTLTGIRGGGVLALTGCILIVTLAIPDVQSRLVGAGATDPKHLAPARTVKLAVERAENLYASRTINAVTGRLRAIHARVNSVADSERTNKEKILRLQSEVRPALRSLIEAFVAEPVYSQNIARAHAIGLMQLRAYQRYVNNVIRYWGERDDELWRDVVADFARYKKWSTRYFDTIDQLMRHHVRQVVDPSLLTPPLLAVSTPPLDIE